MSRPSAALRRSFTSAWPRSWRRWYETFLCIVALGIGAIYWNVRAKRAEAESQAVHEELQGVVQLLSQYRRSHPGKPGDLLAEIIARLSISQPRFAALASREEEG